MRYVPFGLMLVITSALVVGLHGCATVRTMPTLGSYGSPKLFSGARLDYNAATGNREGLEKFKTGAPAYPLLDLPFSAILDTIILPVTVPVATYEFIFER